MRNKVALKISASRALPDSQKKAEQENMGQVKKSVAFLGLVAIIYILYLVFSGQIGSFFSALSGVNTDWVIAGMFSYLAYYAFGVFAYMLAAVADRNSPVGIRDLMSVEAAGIFFSNLTPNGAGGAPAQIVRLTRSGLSVGAAGALQYTRFIVYEAGEGIFAAIMLLFRYQYFIDTYGDVFLVGVFLFGFKIIEVGFLLLVCLKPRWVIVTGNWIVRKLSKHGWMKNEDHWNTVLNTQVQEFSNGFKQAAKNLSEMVWTLVITLLQLGCLYALPFFVLHAFNKPADLLTCLAAGSMLELLTSAIPLPGGTGGAEGGFAFLFKPMFGKATAAGFVVWRMLEYFLPILVAAPLMGLRSNSGISIYTRWTRLKQKFNALRQRKKFPGDISGGISVDMSATRKPFVPVSNSQVAGVQPKVSAPSLEVNKSRFKKSVTTTTRLSQDGPAQVGAGGPAVKPGIYAAGEVAIARDVAGAGKLRISIDTQSSPEAPKTSHEPIAYPLSSASPEPKAVPASPGRKPVAAPQKREAGPVSQSRKKEGDFSFQANEDRIAEIQARLKASRKS